MVNSILNVLLFPTQHKTFLSVFFLAIIKHNKKEEYDTRYMIQYTRYIISGTNPIVERYYTYLHISSIHTCIYYT